MMCANDQLLLPDAEPDGTGWPLRLELDGRICEIGYETVVAMETAWLMAWVDGTWHALPVDIEGAAAARHWLDGHVPSFSHAAFFLAVRQGDDASMPCGGVYGPGVMITFTLRDNV